MRGKFIYTEDVNDNVENDVVEEDNNDLIANRFYNLFESEILKDDLLLSSVMAGELCHNVILKELEDLNKCGILKGVDNRTLYNKFVAFINNQVDF
jgi:hypothetical protein